MVNNKIKVEVRVENHQLPLLGILTYEFSRKLKTIKLFIDGVMYKTMTGSDAEELFFQLENEHGTLTKQIVVSIAAKVTSQDINEMYSKTRKSEVVFARYLAMVGMNERLDMSPTDCTREFDQDHSLFYNAKDRIGGRDKHLTSLQHKWIESFNTELDKWQKE